MKRKLWLPVVLMLSCGLLTACQSTGEVPGHVGAAGNETVEDISEMGPEEGTPVPGMTDESPQVTNEGDSEPPVTEDKVSVEEDVEVPKHEILLVKRRSNMAWGYQDQGYFIDTDGCVYRFDLAASPVISETGEKLSLIESLKVIRENSEGEPVFDESVLSE